MYRYLRGEIFKSGYSIKKLADELGMSEKTLRNKINGITDFTWPEALAIRKLIKPEAEIEVLFEKEEQQPTASREEKAAG